MPMFKMHICAKHVIQCHCIEDGQAFNNKPHFKNTINRTPFRGLISRLCEKKGILIALQSYKYKSKKILKNISRMIYP